TNLPPGLSIGLASGTISGTPTAAGPYPNVTITITDATNASASKTYTLFISQPVSIAPPVALPHWTINRNYPGTPSVPANGITPYTWSATGMPPGLSIDPSTGLVLGTPTATGTFSANITVVDAAGASASKPYSIVIHSAPSITTASL